MGLCWLHISDIHFQGKHDWRDGTVRKKLLHYLRDEFAAKPQLRPDLIFCTGDIAFGATNAEPLPQQYQSAQQFFTDLRRACGGLPVERLFLVPGNHDVNRREVNQLAQKQLVAMAKQSRQHVAEVAKWPAGQPKEFRDIMARLAEYRQFIEQYVPHQHDPDGHCHYAQRCTINGIDIGIAGFNSAWSCAGPEDKDHVWLGAEWQFNRAWNQLESAALRIGLMHHPLEWLCEAEKPLVRQNIAENFHFWLGGHVHDAWVDPGHCVHIAAGAIGAETMEEFGFNLAQIQDDGQVAVHLHTWQHGWMKKNIPHIAPDGVHQFALSQPLRDRLVAERGKPLNPGNPVPGKVRVTPPAGTAEMAQPQEEDASRIADTIAALKSLLGRAQLPELPPEAFDPATGLPEALATALQQADKPRAKIAEDSFDQILKLARQLKTLADAGAGAAIWAAARKNQVRMQLLNAAQPVILLGARLRQRLPLQAGKSSCAVLNEISVSVLSREEIAAHIEAEFHPGKPVQLRDPHLFASTSVEMGTLDADETRGPIAALLKQLYKSLYPAWEVPRVLTHEHVAEIEGEFSQFKKDGKQVLLTLRRDASDSYLTDAVITAIARFHVDVIEILGADGPLAVFDYADGRWQATLKTLYRELQPFNL